MKINSYGDFGFVENTGNVFTYEIEGGLSGRAISRREIGNAIKLSMPTIYSVKEYKVLAYGENNAEPDTVKEMISGNRLLPKLLEKLIQFLYGQGPVLYYNEIDEEGKVTKKYVADDEITDWLESWELRGLDDYKTYLVNVIRSYYYMECYYTKWRFSVSSLLDTPRMPVSGLEFIETTRARLATKKNIFPLGDDLVDRDFTHVVVGNWRDIALRRVKVYKRFDRSAPLQSYVAVSYNKNRSFGEEIYGYNTFFKGIKSWIVGSNLTPDYINSYLENSLSAKIHVIIPSEWIEMVKQKISETCNENREREAAGRELLKCEGIDVGCEFSMRFIDIYVKNELRRLSSYLSGAGKNQGKAYVSYSFKSDRDEARWRFEEIPVKYKEFIESLTNYDKRADEILVAALGIDSSISNISKGGVISKSGADAYYNYLIHVSNQAIAEETICKDINFAIKLNFPEKYKQGIRLGFRLYMPPRQEETSPQDRLKNQNE